MAHISVGTRFRPLNSKKDDESICISRSDSQSFTLKDEKVEQYVFSFDKVYSEQAEVYDILARPIVRDDASQDRAEEIVKDRYEATNSFLSTTIISADSSQFKREKLKKVEDLVQKHKTLNSDHNEAQTDYISSLCEKTNPNDIYISEILLASGLLLRDLGCFEFHSSGHPINPELFLVLEHTRFSNLQKGKFHRKLIFDSVNEILVRKFSSPSKMMQNPRKLLSEVCLEIEQQQVHKKGDMCDLEEGDDLKRLLRKDVLKKSENWTDFHDESPVIAVEVERLIFRDLVNEIVMSEVFDGKIWANKMKKK